VVARYGCGVPSVATLISRAAARYLGFGGPTVARELARTALRELGGAAKSTDVVAPGDHPSRLARAAYVAWLAALALFALVVLNVDLLAPRGAATVFRLFVGSVLLVEGTGLLLRRFAFRTVVIERLTAVSARHPSRLRRTAWKHVVAAGLTGLGLVWVAAGTFDILRGLQTVF
jgi:hypothetical protein